MDDAKREPVAPDPEEDERDPARNATAEFRVPDKASLTRPDISIRRPVEQDDGAPDDAPDDVGADEPEAGEQPPDPPAATGEAPQDDAPQAAEEADEAAGEAADEEAPADETRPTPPVPGAPQQVPGPWQASLPATPPQAPPQAAPQTAPQTTEEAPRSGGGAGPTRVEPLPVPSAQTAPPQTAPPQTGPPQQTAPPQQQYPTAGSSGQWSVPWDGPAPAPQPAPSTAQSTAPPITPPAAPSTAPPAIPPAAPEAEEGKPRRGRRWLVVLVAVLVLVVGIVAGQLIRPVPDPTVELAIPSSHTFPGQASRLPWPSVGQSAVHVEGLGTMGASGGAAPTPTASVAKVMTAYVYLRDHPLKQGEAGPVLTVSPQAAAQIPMRKKRGESLLGVTANQRLTQRKALEALLVISANDVAHELARWDSGNEQAFVAKMNAAAKSLGMNSTRYTDPSGYDARTVSTAADQVKLLRAAMRVPAFTQVVSNRAYVPDDGTPPRPGGNFLLGQYGVVGGKTGYTDAAGGNFVFAARKDVGGVNTLIVGAVMGQRSPTAAGAVSAARQLVIAAEGALVPATVAPKGATVAKVDDGLGGTTPLRAASPVTVVGWAGLTVPVGVAGDPPHRAPRGERVAALTAGAAKVPLRLGRALEKPSILHRLLRTTDTPLAG